MDSFFIVIHWAFCSIRERMIRNLRVIYFSFLFSSEKLWRDMLCCTFYTNKLFFHVYGKVLTNFVIECVCARLIIYKISYT